MPASTPITHVSDTARWVAIYRAMESERSDALFRDPYARRLGGARGEEIVRAMPRGRAMAWPMVVRTAVMDELIVRAVPPLLRYCPVAAYLTFSPHQGVCS